MTSFVYDIDKPQIVGDEIPLVGEMSEGQKGMGEAVPTSTSRVREHQKRIL